MAKYIFPLDLARGAWSNTVTPSWTTTEQTTASGRYRGLTTQTAPKYDFSYTFNAISERELNNILEFYNARKGTLQPFFVSDSVSMSCENQQLLRINDAYPLIMKHTNEVPNYVDVKAVYVNGIRSSDYTVTDGILTVNNTDSASIVTATYNYYHRVRFKDAINITELFYNAYRVTVKFTTAR